MDAHLEAAETNKAQIPGITILSPGLDEDTANSKVFVEDALDDSIPVVPAAASRALFEPVLPAATVLKLVKAKIDVLQTKAAKDVICRSASIFTLYLASA